MAILKGKPKASSDNDRILKRVFPVTPKLTKEEWGSVTEFARSQGLARGEWIRDVILREVRGGSVSDPSLAEILGVRLLLVNVLRPLAAGQRLTPEAFDKLLDQISDVKHQLASTLATASSRNR
ncbi:MAG: hypothetical protein WAM98_20130 [Terriglobales bacterium]